MWGIRAQGAILAGLVTSASLMAGLALAQDPQNPFAGECTRTATSDDVEGARGAHQSAKQFYERAEYENAIRNWRDVLKFDCNAIGTLLNLANAYEKLGDRQNAIFALETYIKRVPEGTDVSKIEARVQNLKELQAKAAAAASVSVTAAPSATTPPPPPSATTPPIMVKPHGAAPFVVVGIGAAAVVVGAIMIPIGNGNINDAKCYDSGANGVGYCKTQEQVDQANSGNTTVRAGSVVLGIGAAAVVGGLAWEFLANAPAPKKDDKPTTGRVRFSPTFGPGMNGAVVHGTF